MSIDNKSSSGHLSTSKMNENTKKIQAVILEDQQQIIEVIAELFGMICGK